MKTSRYTFITLFICTLLFSISVFPQEINDSSAIWRIETNDGNEFFGTVVNKDSASVRLHTKMLGEITIPVKFIVTIAPVDQESIKQGEIWLKNLQSTRYFYAPNGYGLDKGSGYYQNTWVMFNQMSYGFTNYFSVGVGMVPMFLFGGEATPVWVLPKLSVPIINEKLNLGCGAMLGGFISTESDQGVFGITYITATAGNRDRNLTLGFGYPFSNTGWSPPMFNLSGLMRVGKKGYLLTENYVFSIEDDYAGAIMLGGRTVWSRLSLDYGLVIPVNLAEVFIAIPWLGFTLPLGKK
jgi:hypothetical protein